MDSDYDRAGVAIAIWKKWLFSITEVKEQSRRVISTALKAEAGDITFTSTYSPSTDHDIKERETFYEKLGNEIDDKNNWGTLERKLYQK